MHFVRLTREAVEDLQRLEAFLFDAALKHGGTCRIAHSWPSEGSSASWRPIRSLAELRSMTGWSGNSSFRSAHTATQPCSISSAKRRSWSLPFGSIARTITTEGKGDAAIARGGARASNPAGIGTPHAISRTAEVGTFAPSAWDARACLGQLRCHGS